MRTHTSKLLFIIVITFFYLISSCKKQSPPACDGSSPTYESEIKTIVSSSCLGSSCHGSGSNNGDYSTYQKLKVILDNGEFKKRVIDKRDMPKGSKLSTEQLTKIVCWKDNNYPEK